MTTVKVPALKPLTHKGHSYVRGDVVEMSSVEALAYARSGVVALGKGAVVTPDQAVERRDMDPESPRRRRRGNYKRRDMTADSTE